jgi:hypothetical protein
MRHKWTHEPGATPSEVDRKRCVRCGLIQIGRRDRAYFRDGKFWKAPGDCPGRPAPAA